MSDTTIAVFGISFMFFMTTLGASAVFLMRGTISDTLNSVLAGFASGVMLAASVWSLLIPALDAYDKAGWVPVTINFIVGGLTLIVLDYLLKHRKKSLAADMKKSLKMFAAVTIHNIPEGLAVGFAFGAAFADGEHAAFLAALGLAVGIGIQNLPEGAAVAMPMKAAVGKKSAAFAYGAASGAVEPPAAMLGIFLSSALSSAQPWFSAFAAGMMIFVVFDDLLPDSKAARPYIGALGAMVGFALMMVLEVVLGA